MNSISPTDGTRFSFDDATIRAFQQIHWGRSIYVGRIDPVLLDTLASELNEFDTASLIAGSPNKVSVWFDDLQGNFNAVDLEPTDANKFYAGGNAVYIPHIDTPAIEQLRRALGSVLGRHPSNYLCSLFGSHPRHVTASHFDHIENFTIQLRGSKTWRIAENPGVRAPVVNYSTHTPRPHHEELWLYAEQPLPSRLPDECREVRLEPGSALYVPRGYWHEVICDDEESLSLLISFPALTWADAVLPALRTHLLRREAWRENASFSETANAGRLVRLAGLRADLVNIVETLSLEDLFPSKNDTIFENRHDSRYRVSGLCTVGRYGRADGQLDLVIQSHAGDLSRRLEVTVPAQWEPVIRWLKPYRRFSSLELADAFPELQHEAGDLLRLFMDLDLIYPITNDPSLERKAQASS